MRWYIVLGILVVSMTTAALVFYDLQPLGKRRQSAQHAARADVLEVAAMTVEDMHLIEQTYAGDSWQLFAQSASFYDTKQLVFMHHVRGQLLSNDQQSVDVEADVGQLDSATGNVSVRGGVQLRYLQDYTIETDVLYWDAPSRVLQTDTAVKIVSAFVQIAGTGLYGHVEQQSFILRDDVHASFRLR